MYNDMKPMGVIMSSNLYLKYRPSQLSDIVGQKHVVATLQKASSKNQFSHAYLFGGERGCGKTSTARILSALMNCENLENDKLCGKCNACLSIGNGSSIDVKELNGATSRGINDVKSIIENSHWSPQDLKRKIYIIDEVHQLTTEASSALLKILEEPPSYVTFILCTTDVDKLLSTILSRCQRFKFKKITSKDISVRLSYIAGKEEINIDNNGLNIISKLARGSMRDAIGYLDQIGIIGHGKEIKANHIQSYFGATDRVAILQIIKSIVTGNVSLLLDQINDMIVASVDIKEILLEISDVFRNIMILKVQKKKTQLVDLPDHEIKELREIGENISMSHLMKLSTEFANIDRKMEFNINGRWITEATLIKCVAILRK